MKNKYKIIIPIFSILLFSCSSKKEVSLNEYQTFLNIFDYKDEVKILQLTDIHWNFGTDLKKQTTYLKKLVELADPDIIISTGDNVLAASKNTFKSLINTLDSLKNSSNHKIYYSTCFGNHDREGIYGPSYPTNLFKSYSKEYEYDYSKEYDHYGLYKDPDDSIKGRGNSVINLTSNNKTIWSLYLFDSGSDKYNGLNYDYDAIDDSQISLFNSLYQNIKENNDNEYIPSLSFIHIPLFETVYAYDNAKRDINPLIDEGDFGGEFNESEYSSSPLANKGYESVASYIGYKNFGFFDACKNNNVKGIFYGHDHINNFWALYDNESYIDSNGEKVNPNGLDDDILLAYGTKTGNELYYDSSILGGNLITLKKNKTFDGHEGKDFKWIIKTYEN